jgi:hypothetical protein
MTKIDITVNALKAKSEAIEGKSQKCPSPYRWAKTKATLESKSLFDFLDEKTNKP